MYTRLTRNLMFLMAFAMLITGCRKEVSTTENEPGTENIAAILKDESRTFTAALSDPSRDAVSRSENGEQNSSRGDYPQLRFRFLNYALERTGLNTTLAQAAQYTVFAPSDDAFRDAGFRQLSDLDNLPLATLRSILLYHVLGAKVMAAQVPAGPNAEVTTLNGAKAYVTRKADGSVYINGVPVVLADIAASNGVIHVIRKVLMPPVGNIVETVVANPDFSYLVAAVLRASQGSVNVAAVLSGAGPFTVFAPTNKAFMEAGFPDIASITAASPATLTAILTYHVIAGRVFSSDLVNGMTPTMLNGLTTRIILNGFPRIQGRSNTEPSKIIATDRVATNGVIHTIDRVLLP